MSWYILALVVVSALCLLNRFIAVAIIRRLQLGRLVVAAFFAPGCEPCTEQLPKFAEHAARYHEGEPTFLAVLFETGAHTAEMAAKVARLEPHAHVILEPPGGPVATAFGVSTVVPAYVIVGDGIIMGTMNSVDQIPTFEPADA